MDSPNSTTNRNSGSQLATECVPRTSPVPGADRLVLDLNRQEQARQTCENHLEAFAVSP